MLARTLRCGAFVAWTAGTVVLPATMSIAGAQTATQSRVSRQAALVIGGYGGQYECGKQVFALSLKITRLNGSTIEGEALLPSRLVKLGRRGEFPWSPLKVNGEYDAAGRSVDVSPERDLILLENGAEQHITLRGEVDTESGYLVGSLDYPTCGTFVLVPDSAGSTNILAAQYAAKMKARAAVASSQPRSPTAPAPGTPASDPRPPGAVPAASIAAPAAVRTPVASAAVAPSAGAVGTSQHTRPSNWNLMSASEQAAWLKEHPDAPRPSSSTATHLPMGVRPPETSQIIRINESELGPKARAGFPPPLTEGGFARGDLIINIYNGRFELAPAAGLENAGYYAHAVAELADKCPNLGMEAAKFQMLPYIVSNARETFERVMKGRGTSSELLLIGWELMSTLTTQAACTYNPRVDTRDQAQVRCDSTTQLARDGSLAPLLSIDAAHDVTLFLGRHACTSEPTAHLARQLVTFGRQAHARLQFVGSMPGPDTPAGRLYVDMFENCSRQAPDNYADGWCACYVQTLARANPPERIVAALAKNPFVDGGTYMRWVASSVPDANALFTCSERTPGIGGVGQSRAPRTTACLIDNRAQPDGDRFCTYRAAWGDFTKTDTSCKQEITSREWGYREVSCAAAGQELSATGPRDWKSGLYRVLDYEQTVADDFTPPLPPDARQTVPLSIRLLKRDKAGLLRRIELSGVSLTNSVPPEFASLGPLERATFALHQEGALLLVCDYVGAPRRTYWYEKEPAFVADGRLAAMPSPRPFDDVVGAATACPVMVRR